METKSCDGNDMMNFDKVKDKILNENHYFLILAIYFYLKSNDYNETADAIYKECSLSKFNFIR